MKMHRFIGSFDFSGPEVSSQDQELINQIKNVLRLSVGEKVVLSVGDNRDFLCNLVDLNKKKVSFKILEEKSNSAEPLRSVVLYCSILKRENFELVAQKAVECGVKRIVPIISSRTVKTGLKTDRLLKIIKEASEQGGRGIIPTLGETISFPLAVEEAKSNQHNLFFDTQGEAINKITTTQAIGIFIGPEGGWSPEEVLSAKEHNFELVSLGPLTLRAETAATVASYLAVHF